MKMLLIVLIIVVNIILVCSIKLSNSYSHSKFLMKTNMIAYNSNNYYSINTNSIYSSNAYRHKDIRSRLSLNMNLDSTPPCVIKVIGVGGGGGNAVTRMIDTGVTGVEFVAMNTDLQALSRFSKIETLNIGKEVTRGLGAGGIADNGRKAAEESRADILKIVQGVDLVFVTAGMGGGTGSGAAPIVAEVAREAGCLTVGVVTKPFGFEGKRRMQQALTAIDNLREVVDTLIIVSNDRLLQIIPENTPLERAFSVADDILRQGVVGISEIIIRPGLINVDFADVRTVMGNAGTALMGIGRASGKNRAEEAAAAAISSPLLDFPIEKAKGVVFNVVGGADMTLQEINAAAEVIYDAVDANANIIFGALVDESLTGGEIAITVIATGFPNGDAQSEKKKQADIEKKPDNDRTITIAQAKARNDAAERRERESKKQERVEDEDDVPDIISRLRKRR